MVWALIWPLGEMVPRMRATLSSWAGALRFLRFWVKLSNQSLQPWAQGSPVARVSERCDQWAWVSGGWHLCVIHMPLLSWATLMLPYPIADAAAAGLANDSVTLSSQGPLSPGGQ